MNFGNQAVGVASAPKTATLKNTQAVALTITSIAISGGTAPGDFVPGGNCPLSPNTLGAGASCSIPVTFQPSALGAETAMLTITDSSATSPQSVALKGTGITPVTLSAGSLGLGSVAVGDTSASKSVTLTNKENVAVNFSSIATAGAFAVASNNCGASVAAGATCSIGITFSPTATGAFTGTLTFADDAANSPQTVSLTGTGIVPVTLSPASLDLGSVAVGDTSASKSVTLTNKENVALNFSSIATAGNFAVASNDCGAGIAAGATCSVSVTFSPAATGALTGTLTFADDGANTPQTVSLRGTGTAAVTLSPSSITFAARSVGTTSNVHHVTLTNKLSIPVSISSVLVSGDFAVPSANNTCRSSIAAGSACVIGVTFTPTAEGTRTGTLTINDNAYGSPLLVSLTGTGNASGLVSLAVTPAHPSIALGQAQQFAATGTFTGGRTADLTTSVTWSSSAPGVATINAAGLASSAAQGSTIISAVLNAISGSTTLTVTAPLLQSIAVTPANPVLAAVTTQQFTATGTYSDGSTQNLTSTVTWSSSTPTVATISTTGLATVVGLGQTTIAAALGAINGSTTSTVNAGFVYTGSLNTPRFQPTATLLNNGMVLIAGGYNNTSGNYLASAELYNPATGTFTPTGSLNTARYFATATLLNNGMVLIAGGYNGGFLASAELYNPATGSFTPTGSLNTERYFATATLLNNGQVLIAGGENNASGSLTSAELYNPATGTFAPTGSLSTARFGHTATLLNNGLVLIAAGFNGSFLTSSELYNPASGTFAPSGSLNTPRYAPTATLLNNGMVLMAGGEDDSAVDVTATAELYNPASGTFTSTGSMNTPRYFATATLLNNGMVLMAGGETSSTILTSAELYNPATCTFSPTGSMNTARLWDTATLLNNGVVLVAGGWNGPALASAELYEPATLTPPNLISISLSPSNPTVPLGTAQRFTATGTFSDSSTEQLASVTWSSSNPAAVSVTDDATNLGAAYAALAAGSATVSACAGAVCGSTTLTVGPPALASIAVTPANGTLPGGLSVQFTATGTYSDGSTQDLTASATWMSSIPGVATINAGGMASGLALGSTTITATSGAVQGTTTLTVTAPLLVSIAVTPPNPSIALGNTQQFTATGTYSDGSTQNLTSTSTWSSFATSVATISTSGLASAVAPGQTTIAAASGAINGSTALTVTPGFVSTGSLNTGRAYHTATLLNNGMVLIAGGSDSALSSPEPSASVELYNPATGAFTPAGSLNTARWWHTATLLNNGMVLIAGGFNSSSGYYLTSAELYNPATGTFTPTGSLHTARYLHTATLLNNGMVLLAGGVTPNGPGAGAELYDPATGTFTPTGSLNTGRYGHTATLLNNGMVLMAGGYNGSFLTSAELYDPVAQTFTVTGSLNTARYAHTATLLNNGMVLMAGGFNASGVLASAEVYSPAGATFTPSGSMNVARYAHTATLLNNSMVLMAGGGGSPSADLYNPATGTFTATGSLITNRLFHTATLLNNGMVLEAGGYGFGGLVLASAELYEPATLTPPNLVSISLSPSNPTVPLGTAQRFTATGTFSDNSTEQLASVTWSSFNPASVSITDDASNLGAAYAVAAGSATVSACTGALCGSTTVTVGPPALVSIAVTPANGTLPGGLSAQFTATGTYSDGSTQDLTATATWMSSIPGVATINAGGMANGLALGNTTITATSGAVQGTTTLTVTAPLLVSIAVTPPNPSIALGNTQQFTATGTYSDGSTQNLTSSVTWSSSVPSVATITSGGVASGLIAGSTTITAASGAVQGSTWLILAPARPPVISTIPASGALGVPVNQVLTATFSAAVNCSTVTSSTFILTGPGGAVAGIVACSGTSATFTPTSLLAANTMYTATITTGVTNVGGGALATNYVWSFVTALTPTVTSTNPTNLATGVPVNQVLSATFSEQMQCSTISASTFALFQGATQVPGIVACSGTSATFTPTSLLAANTTYTATITTGATNVGGAPLPSNYVWSFTTLTVTAGFVYTGSLTTAREAHTATLLNNGLVLMAGGCCDSSGNLLASANLYNPANGTFTAFTGSLNTARWWHTATLLNNGLVLIAGGLGPGYSYLASAELYNPATGAFTRTGSLKTARAYHTATLLNNGLVLIAGGYNSSAEVDSAELYNPATGTFTPTGSLNTARNGHTATLLNNGLVLMAGGEDWNGNVLPSAEMYNPATGTFTLTGSLNTARWWHTATLLNNGMVLIAGGNNSGIFNRPLASAELYDPALGTFTPTDSLNTARHIHTATLLNDGMVLLAGGQDSSGNILASAELYDPAIGTFTLTGSLNTARLWDTATLLNNGLVLMAGGQGSSGSPLASAELYEPATLTAPNLVSIAITPATSTLSPGTTQQFIATGTFSDGSTEQLASVTWLSSDPTVAQISNDASNHGLSLAMAAGTTTIWATPGGVGVFGSATLTVRPTGFVETGSLNTARVYHTATLLNNGLVLMAGGEYPPLASAELYNPATGTFTSTGSLNTARYQHTATLLNNGMVLVAGGLQSYDGYLANAELYNPATGIFTSTGSLNTARYLHTATLLNNGLVLIAGGCCDPWGNYLSSAELYDPATGTFTSTGSLNVATEGHTATLLNNGMVLIAGGNDGSAYLDAAELYNPATGTFTPTTYSLKTAREWHTATLLNNGMVLMAGGQNSSGILTSAELYNPATGTFSYATGSLNTARYQHTATLLNNGMVLVAGGENPSNSSLASAELYNPATGAFTNTRSLNTGRYYHTATLLNNGMVLMTGGYCSSGILASAELY